MKYLLFLALPLFLLDQLTKWLVLQDIGFGTEIPIIPGFFSLVHVTNTGAAFGMLQGNNTFFIMLAAVALVVVLGLFWQNRPSANRAGPGLPAMTKVALALLLAGIVGNLVDRLWRGQVIDFLHFYYRQYEFPSFNVADSCISIAAALLILGSVTSGKDKSVTRNA
ncbi:MAG: signal peptidase II [Verrucomicrobia bacterium]|nr:signal peptidase II [Verrucomicrobiota bacterium]